MPRSPRTPAGRRYTKPGRVPAAPAWLRRLVVSSAALVLCLLGAVLLVGVARLVWPLPLRYLAVGAAVLGVMSWLPLLGRVPRAREDED